MISTTQEDRALGEKALKHFFSESKRLYSENMKISFDQFIDLIDLRSKSYITGLGMGIAVAEISESRIESVMDDLARNSMGKMPDNVQVFTQAIINNQSEFDWNMFKEVSSQTIEDAIEATQALGKDLAEGVKGAGEVFSMSKYILPAVGVIAVIAFLKYNSLSGITKAFKGKR